MWRDPNEAALVAMQALAADFQKTDRIVARSPFVSVRMAQSMGSKVPGYSDGRTITIHWDLFKNIGKTESMVALHGLNYHELSHILFTPRSDSWLSKQLVVENLFHSFNALEDQRIETMFQGRFDRSRRYFAQMVIEFLMKEPRTWPLAHAITYGRKFLPREIRDPFRELFAGTKAEREQLEKIIDEYRLLDLSDELIWARVKILVEQYKSIIDGIQARFPQHVQPDSDCQMQDNGRPDKQQSEQAQKDAKQRERDRKEIEDEDGGDASEFYPDEEESEEGGEDGEDSDHDGEDFSGSDDDESDGESDDGDDEASDGDSSSGSEERESDSASGGSDSEDGEDDSDGVEADGDESASDEESDGAGGGKHRSEKELKKDIREALQDASEHNLDQQDIRDDVNRARDAMNDPANMPVNAEKIPGQEMELTAEMIASASESELSLRRLYEEMEPGWKYGDDHGKVNVGRAMTDPENLDELFDSWDEGREQDAGLEIVILLDTSGSMGGDRIVDACKSMWQLKRAGDECDAKITVLAFDHATRLVYGTGDKVKPDAWDLFPASGSDTLPFHGFRLAGRIMTASEMPNRLFVIITDGSWRDNDEESDVGIGRRHTSSEEMLSMIEGIDAMRVYFGINAKCLPYYKVAFQVVAEGQSASSMAPVIEEIVTTMLLKVRDRR